MTFVHIAIMTAIVLFAMVASMLYYGSRGKKSMRALFDRLADDIGGTVIQRSRMHYPHYRGEVAGSPVELFIHLSEGHKRTSDIIYLVMATPVTLPSASLVVREGYFTVGEDKGDFNEVAGDYLSDLMPGHYIYGTDEEQTTRLFRDGKLAEALAPLSRYPQIVLGPDAITCGKPYGGPRDLATGRLAEDMGHLAALAAHLSGQDASQPPGKQAGKAKAAAASA